MHLSSKDIGKVAKAAGKVSSLEPEAIRDAIRNAVRIGNLDAGDRFLTFAGILPVNLPDGVRIAVLPDMHIPAHHRLVIWAILQFLKVFQPHIVILIGDALDMFALSRYDKPPRSVKNPQEEFDQGRRLLDEILEVSGAFWLIVIPGNHEDRITRYLTAEAPGIASVLDPYTREPILSFHGQMGYTPDDPVTFIYGTQERGGLDGGFVLNDDLTFMHGLAVKKVPGASPRTMMDLLGQSFVHGHTHRLGLVAREVTDKVLQGIELGNLVDPSHDFMAYATMLNNWHPGFAVGHVHNGITHLQPIPIIPVMKDGKLKFVFTYAGKVYTQSDR
jgi:hypothetical protein